MSWIGIVVRGRVATKVMAMYPNGYTMNFIGTSESHRFKMIFANSSLLFHSFSSAECFSSLIKFDGLFFELSFPISLNSFEGSIEIGAIEFILAILVKQDVK